MFNGATVFNQQIDSWNVTTCSSLKGVFNGASSFNQPLNSWVLKSSNLNLSQMFTNASAFNK